jgi:hypothetical protein
MSVTMNYKHYGIQLQVEFITEIFCFLRYLEVEREMVLNLNSLMR